MGVIPQEMLQTPQPVNYYSDASTTNDLTGGLPINLDSLRDGPPGSKPFYPYSTLIRYAVSSVGRSRRVAHVDILLLQVRDQGLS